MKAPLNTARTGWAPSLSLNKRLYCYKKIVSKCFKVYLDADVIRVAKVC